MMKVKHLFSGILAMLAVMLFTGCEEFLNSLDNPVSPELQMSESPVTMKIGETYTRTARVRSDAIVAYSSSNEAVATVDEKGTVTAQAEGTTTITASVTGGKVQYTNISFTPMSLSYEVTVEDATDPMLAIPLTLEATSAGDIKVTGTIQVACSTRRMVVRRRLLLPLPSTWLQAIKWHSTATAPASPVMVAIPRLIAPKLPAVATASPARCMATS